MKQPGFSKLLGIFRQYDPSTYPTMAEAYRVAAINGLNRVS